MASSFYYHGKPLQSDFVSNDPTYVLLDRSLADGAEVTLPLGSRVFANRRMEIYRLTDETETQAALERTKLAAGAPE
jgi:hypothetical protein